MMEFSSCCKNISAMVLEIGEPMTTPLSIWYIWLVYLVQEGEVILPEDSA